MKNCTELAPLLSAFLDGELTEAECAEVRAHLESCESCREKLAEYAAVSAGLSEAFPEAEVPEGFTEGVMSAVRAEKTAKRKAGRTWRRFMPIAACAAVVLLTVALFPGMSSMNEAADTAAPETAYNGAAMLAADDAAEADGADDEAVADTELTRDSFELVQSSAYSGGSLPSMSKMADDSSAYFFELREVNGEERALWCDENGAVLLALYGQSAAEYVKENGGVEGGAGYYYLPVSALYALPEGITLSDAQSAALAELPEEAEWVLVYPAELSEEAQE